MNVFQILISLIGLLCLLIEQVILDACFGKESTSLVSSSYNLGTALGGQSTDLNLNGIRRKKPILAIIYDGGGVRMLLSV